jgi:DNA-binding CsgD family transcriptional regulator
MNMKINCSNNRMLNLFGTMLLFAATLLSIRSGAYYTCIIPYTHFVIPAINGICTLLSLVLLFNPDILQLQITILTIQSVTTTLTGIETLGCFLYAAMIILLFINGFFIAKRTRKIIFFTVVWMTVILGMYPFGWERIVFALAISLFYYAFFSFIYKKLESKLSYLLPPDLIQTTAVKLPEKGSTFSLISCGLTQRQADYTLCCIKENMNYAAISKTYNISISVVKKEISSVCRKFGVQNREMLRVLLLQYRPEK